jgi:competence protein ComEC
VEGHRNIAATPRLSKGVSIESSRPAGLGRGAWDLLIRTPPLYLVAAAVVSGDALGNLHLFIPFDVAAGFTIAAVVMFLMRRSKTGIVLALLGIIAAATMPLKALLAPPQASGSLRLFADGSLVSLEGWVVRAPEYQYGGRTYLYVSVDRAGLVSTGTNGTSPASGLIRVTVLGDQHFQVGDRVALTGRLRFPRNDGDPGEFDYAAWLMRDGIAGTIVTVPRHGLLPIEIIGHRKIFPAGQIQAIREHIGQFINSTLQYPESAEMRALIIGDRGGIDEPLRQPFALTGMAHLLVISGLHLGFVAGAAFLIARLAMSLFPMLTALGYANKFGAIAAALAVSAYASIAGGHVSTIRALVMVLAYTTAIVIDRAREPLASLTLAALIICFLIPGSTADIGFQLSFASVTVIMLGMRRFTAWWRWHYANPLSVRSARPRFGPALEWIFGYIAVSFWAMLGTAPLTACHFNQFSLVGLIANAVVVPIMGLGSVICGLAAAALSFVYAPLARGILLIAGQLAATGTYLARWFENWPLAWARIFTPTSIELVIVYGLLVMWLNGPLEGEEVLRAIRQGRAAGVDGTAATRRWRSAASFALLVALITDVGWWVYQRYLNPNLRITFLSVGEGDAAVLRFPGSRVMLIDGGGAFRGSFDPGERIVAPYLWSNKIMHVDYIALSHPDRDHFGGLIFVVHNFSPLQFWTAGATSPDASYGELLAAVRASGARQWLCDSAAAAMIVGGVNVRCVGPLHNRFELKHNNSSMIVRLVYGAESFLFTGDVEARGESELIAMHADLHAAVLKVPHHGSRTSSSAAFIEAVHPRVAVISLGYLNQFHFPAPEVLERYQEDGVQVLRTDADGAISVDATRSEIELSTFRHGPVTFPQR